jgi:hypothetical protein
MYKDIEAGAYLYKMKIKDIFLKIDWWIKRL